MRRWQLCFAMLGAAVGGQTPSSSEPIEPDPGAKSQFPFGRGFGLRGQWALSARYEMPLTASGDGHTFNAGLAYVFR